MIKVLYVNGLNEGIYLWRIENFAKKMVKLKERCAVHVIFPVAITENVAWDKICIGYNEQTSICKDSYHCFHFACIWFLRNPSGAECASEFSRRYFFTFYPRDVVFLEFPARLCVSRH